MELPNHIREALRDLGFTDYEISIYLTLVTKGALNAKELSKESGVPYSRIYQILQSLHDKDFVMKDEEIRPTQYAAVPPRDALESAKERYFRDVNEKTKSLFDVLNPIYLMKSIPQRLDIYQIEGDQSCYLQIDNLISDVKDSVYISTSSEELLRKIFPRIEKLRLGGINQIKLLYQMGTFSSEEVSDDLFKKYTEIAEMRSSPAIFGSLIIVDDSNRIFFMFKKNFLMNKGENSGMFSENLLVGPLFREWFNYLWSIATPIPSKEAEQDTNDF